MINCCVFEDRYGRIAIQNLGGRVTIISALSNDPAASPRLPTASWLSRLRAAKGYDLAVCAVGSAWFLLLAMTFARKVFDLATGMSIADFGPVGWPALVSSVCLFLFYLTLWWLMLIRPAPRARTDGLLPSVIAFAGGYVPLAIPLFAPGGASAGQNLVSAALLVVGTTLMLVAILHLGRSFSIVPQARSLVRTGPYAVVRNPLYLAEEIAMLGALLQYYSTVTLLLWLLSGALQVGRIFYEEQLLRRTFADYDEYAKETFRLIPYVW
jgi:protein-S-isoprenylcysteine O-methyltransferase Ste14